MDITIESLYGNLSAASAEEPLTLYYAGDEPYYRSVKGWPKTLLVQLHSWNGDLNECLASPALQQIENCVWICPNFGGQNNQPYGAGHPVQMERIKRVIDKTREEFPMIERVILQGTSGGGYVGLMVLGTYPGIAYGASLWVFPYDLADWYNQKPQYRSSLEACFGGPPVGSLLAEYDSRSPKSVNISGVELHLNSSDEDTEVPYAQELAAVTRFSPTNNLTFRNFPGGHITQWDVAVNQIKDMQP